MPLKGIETCRSVLLSFFESFRFKWAQSSFIRSCATRSRGNIASARPRSRPRNSSKLTESFPGACFLYSAPSAWVTRADLGVESLRQDLELPTKQNPVSLLHVLSLFLEVLESVRVLPEGDVLETVVAEDLLQGRVVLSAPPLESEPLHLLADRVQLVLQGLDGCSGKRVYLLASCLRSGFSTGGGFP